jgi:hypothetical protein
MKISLGMLFSWVLIIYGNNFATVVPGFSSHDACRAAASKIADGDALMRVTCVEVK